MQHESTWRVIPSHSHYEASADGQVRRCVPGRGTWVGRVLRTPPDSEGYPTVNLDGQPRRVHVLVAEAFIGPIPPGGEVHHRNENRADARASNLEITPSKLAHGERHRHARSARRRHGEQNDLIACACGCGSRLRRFDAEGRPRAFVTGHNRDDNGRYVPREMPARATAGQEVPAHA